MISTVILAMLALACAVLAGCGHSGGNSLENSSAGTWLTTQSISGGQTGTYLPENRTTVQMNADGTFTVRNAQNQQFGSGAWTRRDDQLTFTTIAGVPPVDWLETEAVAYNRKGD